MSSSDKYPTIGEVLDGDAPFDSRAVHDAETGMYVMPEPPPTVSDADMLQTDSGLWLPRPSQKLVTRMMFRTGMMIDVSESHTAVLAAVNGHKTGDLTFTGPVHADDKVVIKSSHVKDIAVITTASVDLKEIEVAMKQREYQLSMAQLQMLQTGSKNNRQSGRRLN